MATAETITQKLVAAFQPTEIDVQDVSHQHAGHAENNGGGALTLTRQIHRRVFAASRTVEQASFIIMR